jgi:hypothetical protein
MEQHKSNLEPTYQEFAVGEVFGYGMGKRSVSVTIKEHECKCEPATPLMQTPRYLLTCKSEGHVDARSFLSHGPKNTNRSFYFPIGKSAPTANSPQDLLFTIGRSDFVTSQGQWSNIQPSNPRYPMTVNADPFFSLSGLSLSQFRHS